MVLMLYYVFSSYTHYSSDAIVKKRMHAFAPICHDSATSFIHSMQNRRHTQAHRSSLTHHDYFITYVRQKFSCSCCSHSHVPHFALFPRARTSSLLLLDTIFFFLIFSCWHRLKPQKRTVYISIHVFAPSFFFVALITTKNGKQTNH